MRRRERTVPLTDRVEALQQALDVGGHQLDPALAERARGVVTRAGERAAITGGHTVVALAGATGSGKSSLFNAIVGGDVADISPRRPTTSVAGAAVWGEDDASELLDWLDIDRRHQVMTTGDNIDLAGLVLVDLPDVDSRELANRVEADRILERADVFVWVTDPQKYADARLHDDYLKALRHHDTVMLLVLNQVDRIRQEGGADLIARDLSDLVRADGAGDHEVIQTSTRTMVGIEELTSRIGAVVAERAAAEARLVADVRRAAEELSAGVAESTPTWGGDIHDELHDALRVAAGVPVVLDAVQRDYRRRSHQRAGWPITRWLSGLRSDPLQRLRLGDDTPGPAGIAPSDVRGVLGRSSLPNPTPAARANVHLATRQLADATASTLPPRWSEAVLEAADPPEDDLADALDQAVLSVPLRTRPAAWWSLFGGLQWLFLATAAVGLAWLLVLMVAGWLQLPLDVPMVGFVPWPLLLLGGGLLAGILLALLASGIARIGAARRRARVEDDLDDAIDGVAEARVSRPVQAVLDRHEQTRAALERSRA